MADKLLDPPTTNLTPDQFLKLYREIRDARHKLDEASGVHRAAKKRAKEAGVDLAALSLMEQLSKLDEDEAQLRIRNLRRYMAWDGGGEQLSLFGDLSDDAGRPTAEAQQEHTRFTAREAGFARGRAGDSADENPHQPGTELSAAWYDGWSDGQAAIAAEMAPGAKKASTSRKLRTPAAV